MQVWDKLKGCQPHPVLKDRNEIDMEFYDKLPTGKEIGFYISSKTNPISPTKCDLIFDVDFYEEFSRTQIVYGSFTYHYQLTVKPEFQIPAVINDEYASYLAIPLMDGLKSFLGQVCQSSPDLIPFANWLTRKFTPADALKGITPINNPSRN